VKGIEKNTEIHSALIAANGGRVKRLAVHRLSQLPDRVALGVFDLDHLCAKIREDLCRPWPCENTAQVEDAKATLSGRFGREARAARMSKTLADVRPRSAAGVCDDWTSVTAPAAAA
jgi:hypothetical protein